MQVAKDKLENTLTSSKTLAFVEQVSFGISTFGRWRQKDQEFKVILNYIKSLRPSWATRDTDRQDR